MDGERLAELRESRGLNQTELASVLCLSQSAISKYERGEAEANHTTLIRLSEYFNVSIEYLLGISREMNPPRVISSTILLHQIPEQAVPEIESFLAYIKIKYKSL